MATLKTRKGKEINQVLSDDGKVSVLEDSNLLEALDSADFDAERKVEFIAHGDRVNVALPRYILAKFRSYDEDVRAVMDLQPLTEPDAGDFAAKLIADKVKIMVSKNIAWHQFDPSGSGESDFMVSVSQDVLEPGRGEGGSRFDFSKYTKLRSRHRAGETLNETEQAYLDNEDFKKRWVAELAEANK